ncbi:MAG: aminopeptidase P family protein [Thermoanaerobacteraceae bacterium]|nr:aminopeptidase P family protein [Thermoanaerobacteraceae bacterium]
MFSAEEFYKRIRQLQVQLKKKELDCALVVQDKDLFYYSGTAQNAHLVVPAEGEPLLLVKKDFDRAVKESPLKQVQALQSLKNLPDIVIKQLGYRPRRIGLEMDVLPVKNYLYYQKLFPEAEFSDVSNIIRLQRMVKSPQEIELTKKAAQLHLEVFRQIPRIIKEGMTEIELAAEIESLERKRGHLGLTPMRGFNQHLLFGQVLSGESGSIPSSFEGPAGGQGLSPVFPQSAGWKKIKPHEPIFVDHMGYYHGYQVDMTRVFSLGPLPKHLMEAHQAAVDIQNRLVEEAKPGVSCQKLYELAVQTAEDRGLAKHFLGFEYTLPFVGHGVGLEVDELPVLASRYDRPLVAGAVIAIEPKFIFPGEGIVGVENTYVVKDDGLEKLTTMDDDICII